MIYLIHERAKVHKETLKTISYIIIRKLNKNPKWLQFVGWIHVILNCYGDTFKV